MPPATRSAEREEERRLNTRTLTIASVASATAAAVTSQLWIAGTWVAAAITPVIVTLLSEALHRPTERMARAWSSDLPALGKRVERPREAVAPPHGDPLRRRDPDQLPRQPRLGAAPFSEPIAAGPVRVYRQPTSRAPRRSLALGAVAATAAIAFVVAVVVLTAGDLVSGGSIGKGGGRTTFFGGQGKNKPAAGAGRHAHANDAGAERHEPRPDADHRHDPGAASVRHRTRHAAARAHSDRADAGRGSIARPGYVRDTRRRRVQWLSARSAATSTTRPLI